MQTDTQVAIMGAGITGTLTACLLADAGLDVVLVDPHGEPMHGASLRNEGKIHLGFTYVGTANPATARLMIEGARVFHDTLDEVCGRLPDDSGYTDRVIYLVDPHSQFPGDELWRRSLVVAGMLEDVARYAPTLARWARTAPAKSAAASAGALAPIRRLPPALAGRLTGQARVADAWETAERAVAPGPVARHLRDAARQRALPCVKACVQRVTGQARGWRLDLDDGSSLRADVVVNCSWESRALLDAGMKARPGPVSIRYKRALFGSGLRSLTRLAPSTRILGRYGDITPYGNGEAYLSWYPAGLAGLSDDGRPPIPSPEDADSFITRTLAGLGLENTILEQPTARWEVAGGYVVAHGSGDIDHPDSPLHDRSQPDARLLAPGYVTVDTGKYSLGPLMARRAAALVRERALSPFPESKPSR